MTGDLLITLQWGILLLVIIAVAVGRAAVDDDGRDGTGR
jgi:hypothetical protein